MRSRAAILVFFILTSTAHLARAAENRRDGNWWRDLPKPQKVAYIVGFMDGTSLGSKFSYWGMQDFRNNPCTGEAIAAFGDQVTRYFANATSGQISDGLDSLYSDYKNRAITLDNGVWIVLKAISGVPKGELDALIESYRRNARH